jgi:hypothetical protein
VRALGGFGKAEMRTRESTEAFRGLTGEHARVRFARAKE